MTFLPAPLEAQTKLERELPPELGALIREFRLQNPHAPSSPAYELYAEQCRCNLVILGAFAAQIREICRQEGRDEVLFSTRDCCLLQELFTYLHPEIRPRTYHTSRLINLRPSPDYVAYIRNLYHDRSIIVDLNGSFKSGRQLYQQAIGRLPRVHLMCFNQMDSEFEGLTFSCEHKMSDYIERLNVDSTGTLYDYRDGLFRRHPLENNAAYVRVIHQTLGQFLKYLDEGRRREEFRVGCAQLLQAPPLYARVFSSHFFSSSYDRLIRNS